MANRLKAIAKIRT